MGPPAVGQTALARLGVRGIPPWPQVQRRGEGGAPGMAHLQRVLAFAPKVGYMELQFSKVLRHTVAPLYSI